jgi:hypothetical protein
VRSSRQPPFFDRHARQQHFRLRRLVIAKERSVASPTVAEADVIVDVLERGIDSTEFRANAFDEGADIGAITLLAIAGGEALATYAIVNLAIGNGFAGAQRQ